MGLSKEGRLLIGGCFMDYQYHSIMVHPKKLLKQRNAGLKKNGLLKNNRAGMTHYPVFTSAR